MKDYEHKCKPSTPPDGMKEWVDLAIRYEEAEFGNDMTDQTRQALQQMGTFLLQPAAIYCQHLEDADDGA